MNTQNDLAGDALKLDIKPTIAKARAALVTANKSLAAARHRLQAGKIGAWSAQTPYTAHYPN
jgi:hypothetical protein